MFICLFLLALQDLSELKGLESRIQVLEHRINPDKISELSNQIQQSDQRFQQERNYVDRELLKLELRLNQAEFLDQKLTWFGFGSGAFLIGIFFGWKKLIFKEVEEKMGVLLKTNEDSLKQLTRSFDQDQKHLDSHLLVLSHDGTKIKKILESQGFSRVTVKIIVENPKWDEDHFDLVVFDHLSADFIDSYMAQSHKDVFIGYATQGQHVPVADKARINFANGEMTLFGQVLQTARYSQHMAEQKAKEAA